MLNKIKIVADNYKKRDCCTLSFGSLDYSYIMLTFNNNNLIFYPYNNVIKLLDIKLLFYIWLAIDVSNKQSLKTDEDIVSFLIV